MLQNSDDAQSKAVEIHFETQDYVDRKEGKHVQQVPGGSTVELPDLKTTLVCVVLYEFAHDLKAP